MALLKMMLLWTAAMVEAASSAASSSSATTVATKKLDSSSDRKDTTNIQSSQPASYQKRLTLDTMNAHLKTMEYAVRGQVVIAADQIHQELQDEQNDNNKYPFDHIVYTNIGNPQAVGQMPLTWPRQVLALCELPPSCGINHPHVEQLFPRDVVQRAKRILQHDLQGTTGTGAYSHSKGVLAFRQDVARFIAQRDDMPLQSSNPEHIFLTNGASAAIQAVLQALLGPSSSNKKKKAVLIPIPQYPIYTATVALLGGECVGYYLDEEAQWGLNVQRELERAYTQAVEHDNLDVVALVLINPGNPTGQVLSRNNLQDLVTFCSNKRLVLLADEVYQQNVYHHSNNDENDKPEFVSAKRAAYDAGLIPSVTTNDFNTDQDKLELVSFHSVSKGVFGECGRRGGYMELVGMDAAVVDQLYKLASASLCSSVSGQIMTSLMVHGPSPGDASYESHQAEQQAIFESLQQRARIVSEGLNSIDGFSCQPAAGAMYCFPSVQMPEAIIKRAQQEHTTPDAIYCVDLLQKTGICVVPASGFGQKEGRFGFRTTFLPTKAELERCVTLIRNHYQEFVRDANSNTAWQ